MRVAPAGLVITRVVPGSTAEQAGLRAGDVMLVRAAISSSSAWASAAARRDERARALESGGVRIARCTATPDRACRSACARRLAWSADVSVTAHVGAGQIVKLGNLPPLHVTVDAREVTSPSGRRVGVIGFNVWMATDQRSDRRGRRSLPSARRDS